MSSSPIAPREGNGFSRSYDRASRRRDGKTASISIASRSLKIWQKVDSVQAVYFQQSLLKSDLTQNALGGDPKSQLAMGEFYRIKIASRHKAFVWTKRAADQNYPQAHYKIAKCYLSGIGTAKSEKEALHHLKLAIKLGVKEAQEIHSKLEIVIRARRGDPDALFDLGKKYILFWINVQANKEDPDNERLFQLGHKLGLSPMALLEKAARQYHQGLRQLTWAETLGHQEATTLLLDIKKRNELIDRLKKYPEDSEANKILYQLYKKWGISESISMTKNRLQAAAKSGMPDDLNELAEFLFNQRKSVLFRSDEFIKVCQKAANLGHINAKYRLGQFLTRSEGVSCEESKYNIDLGVRYLLEVSDKGHAEASFACYELSEYGRYHFSHELPLISKNIGFECLKKSALLNYDIAMFALAEIYDQESKFDLAFELYNEVATHKSQNHLSKQAQFVVGERYHLGMGVQKDDQKAFEWFKRASEGSNGLGKSRVADCYLLGEGVEKDEMEAVRLYRENNDEMKLCWCYASGLGVEKDGDKALDHFSRGIKTRNPNSLTVSDFSHYEIVYLLSAALEWNDKALEIQLTHRPIEWGEDEADFRSDYSPERSRMAGFGELMHYGNSDWTFNAFKEQNNFYSNPQEPRQKEKTSDRVVSSTLKLKDLAYISTVNFSETPTILNKLHSLYGKYSAFFDCIKVKIGNEARSIPRLRLNDLSEKIKAQLAYEFQRGVNGVIELTTEESIEAKTLLDFLETGVLNATNENIIDLFDWAQKNLVKVMSSKCCYYLQQNLGKDSFYDVLQHALDSENGDLFIVCCEYFCTNTSLPPPPTKFPLINEWYQFLLECKTQGVTFSIGIPSREVLKNEVYHSEDEWYGEWEELNNVSIPAPYELPVKMRELLGQSTIGCRMSKIPISSKEEEHNNLGEEDPSYEGWDIWPPMREDYEDYADHDL